ncbi:MAG: hypothetical protein LWX56_14195 [Ignavibacteria bacterium]|nr:hypothetical protein [Ignavibacteria bacterium]
MSIPSLRKFLFFIVLIVFSHSVSAQDYIAMLPVLHCRGVASGMESPVQLTRSRVVAFVYANAVAVFTEAELANTSDTRLEVELALPSTGHNENESAGKVSNGILGVQMWVQGERVEPVVLHDDSGEWYTIKARLQPGETRKVKALFWAETSLADIDANPNGDSVAITMGARGFMIDVAHAGLWKGNVESMQVHLVLRDGITTARPGFEAVPGTYMSRDSVLTWSVKFFEPSASDNILVSYQSVSGNSETEGSMQRLASFITKEEYGKLLYYVSLLHEEY